MTMEYFDQSDVEQNKTIVLLTCVLVIFFPILFFLPLVACNNSPYAKFYANQCLLIFLAYFISGIATVFLVGIFLAIAVFIFSIINAVNANNGMRKGIPIIGGIEIIK